MRLSGVRLERFLRSDFDTPETDMAVSWIQGEFGPLRVSHSRMLRAMAAVKLGALPEEISRILSWKEFESFCASLLVARGFEVEENIVTTKPRVQVDLLARSSSAALVIDCKHWSKTMGAGALTRVVRAQAKRADLLRDRMRHLEPMLVVVMLMANEPSRYCEGAAVVPISALQDFLANLPSYSDGLLRH